MPSSISAGGQCPVQVGHDGEFVIDEDLQFSGLITPQLQSGDQVVVGAAIVGESLGLFTIQRDLIFCRVCKVVALLAEGVDRNKLAKATNANGINYATVVVDKRGILPPAVAQTAKAMRQEIKAKYKEIAITMDDYSTSASSNTMAADESALDVQVSDTEFTDVTDKDKDLPFV